MELQRDIINTQTLCFGVCENMRPVVVRHKDNLPRRGLLWVHCHEMPRHDAHKQLFFFLSDFMKDIYSNRKLHDSAIYSWYTW